MQELYYNIEEKTEDQQYGSWGGKMHPIIHKNVTFLKFKCVIVIKKESPKINIIKKKKKKQ